MGKEAEEAAREAVFAPYSLTTELLAGPSPDAIVLHCLPAYRGKEIAAEVIDGPQSVVWDEAENRRHAQKAMLTFLMEPSMTDGMTEPRCGRRTKNARHQQIVELVTHHEVRSQGELAALLAEQGRAASPRPRSRATCSSSTRSRSARPPARWSTPSRPRAATDDPRRRGRPPPARPGWPGSAPSCSSRPRPAPTWSCCAPLPAPPSTSPPPSTRPSCTRSSAPSPATTPSW